jgi:uncharacterized protein YndB with AHSA1/START domain
MSDTIDRSAHTVSFQRLLSASPEDVFDAWTQPEQLSAWWDPSGARLAACAIDLRPGGGFRFETQGHAPPFSGTYSVVERPSRLVFEAMGAVGTVLLQPKAGGTAMLVTIRSPTPEHFAMFLELGVDTGTSKTMDNLVGHLGARAQRSTAPAGLSAPLR